MNADSIYIYENQDPVPIRITPVHRCELHGRNQLAVCYLPGTGPFSNGLTVMGMYTRSYQCNGVDLPAKKKKRY
jgi:hypothetical protein